MADGPNSAETYKEIQERFVSNLNGTTILEVGVVASTAPVVAVFRSFIFSALFFNRKGHLSKWVFLCMGFAVDYLTLIVPVLLGSTLLSDHVKTLITTCLFISFGVLHFCSLNKNKKQGKQLFQSILSSDMSGKRPFIGAFRAYVLIATSIFILAVDFVIFPRRFAKTETYGSGIMDVGVGAFVISHAIVSKEARGVLPSDIALISELFKSLKSSFPLLVLGIARFISVKGTGYQEHVSEYGIHWNFFFTLFALKVLSAVIIRVIPGDKWYGISGLLLASLYQYILSCYDLKSFVLHGRLGNNSREGFLDANREGLCSCAGFLALYLIGVQLGKFLFQKRNTVGQWVKVLLVLITIDVVFYFFVQVSQLLVSPISRRMANLSYVLWQVAYNIQILSSFLLGDIVMSVAKNTFLLKGAVLGGCQVCFPEKIQDEPRKTPSHTEDIMPCTCLIAAINCNQLFYFLLANLLTGVVNFSIQTVHCSTRQGFLIVCIYLLILNLISSILHLKKISLKV
ncbi:phosphatidylinositol-glycan biosynthesis class W protein-like isoform X1 [Montipora capricornis]|uniref:phosphatidylinositol-glycan biosynthesis class W protein-like isoform X1 n=2 Tax=Montipora capricornis TaxID=246305 RepID=UPI0035F1022B